jgi:hypothetical protein
MEAVQETKSCQPRQVASQIQTRGMPGLQGNRQADYEEHQSINKIDDVVINNEKILDEVHLVSEL